MKRQNSKVKRYIHDTHFYFSCLMSQVLHLKSHVYLLKSPVSRFTDYFILINFSTITPFPYFCSLIIFKTRISF
jgi:hypothetical protein